MPLVSGQERGRLLEFPSRSDLAGEGDAWRPLHRAGQYRPGSGARASERRSLIASLLVHGAILGAFLFSFDLKPPIKPETKTKSTFNVSLEPGDGLEVSIPKAAVEKPKEIEKPVEEKVTPPKEAETAEDPVVEDKPVEPQPRPQQSQQKPADGQSDNPSQATKVGGGQLIWTPPPPRPNASGIGPDGAPRREQRVEMPKVDLPKGASDPVLMSYDQGRFSDAVAMSEASRLMNVGTITMAVNVDEKGDVTSCVVISSSGSKMLDERGCLLVKSYKYRPAQDAKGTPHGAIVTEVLEWAKDGKFTSSQPQPAEGAALEAVRSAERAMPQTGKQKAMPTVRMPDRRR